ncbi:HU family DNA-binding protein [Pseudonocardia nematodicida]|uniref:HU family DNA-binding protein n=1 Tax=Pseudonocardia nematodicida TaxID=1206997 RepID=A0ABV1K3A6_9PSEU
MNKAQLVDALAARLGDRRAATAAVDAMVEVIVDTVGAGGSVTLTGFGVFEPRRRAPRTARNPRTGETVPVGETVVPSFRPGTAFRERVAGSPAAAAGATSAPRRAPRDRTAGPGTDAAPDEGTPVPRARTPRNGSSAAGRTTATRKQIPPDSGAAQEKPKPTRRRTSAKK